MSITKAFVVLALAGSAFAAREGMTENPLSKVIDLMTALEVKIAKEGESEAKAFKEYFEWCDDVSKNSANEIATAKEKQEELQATIAKCAADISASTSKIEDLAESIASDQSDLKDATLVREKEKAEFVASEGELMETVDAIDRAIGILEREMAKNPALMQVDTSNFKALLRSLSTVIDAAAIMGKDKKKILALVQSEHQAHSQSEDTEEQKADAEEALLSTAPAPDAYKSHSGGIVEVLEDLKDKAETELSDTRKAEANAAHNYDMLKISLDDSIAAETKDLGEEKAAKAAAEELKATSEGDLAITSKDLAQAEESLATAQSTCMTVAADHEATVAGRKEELAVIAKAKEILASTTAGAVDETYSLLQEASASQLRTRADLAHMEVVSLIKSLARKHHSRSLDKLASQIQVLMQYGAKFGDDPFAKVKGLIMDLITRLEKEAATEASEKAFCDEQMGKTEAKKSELEDDIAKLTAKIDKAAATSAKLKDEVQELQAELAAIAREQAEMDKMRSEEHAAYVDAKKDLEQGLYGVGKALDMLRDYYGGVALLQAGQPPMPEKHAKASGAGAGIIDILKVVQSDMSSELTKEETQEADAAETYEKVTQENKVTTSIKNQDVTYKTADYKGLDKLISELSGDRASLLTELDAVLEYYEKIKDRCIAKPESYESRKARREAEIEGLKQALAILSGEAFLQKQDRAGVLRR